MADDKMTIPVTLPHGKEPVLRVVPMPADASYSGDIFGGWIMAQVDIAGSIPAIRRALGRLGQVDDIAATAADRRAERDGDRLRRHGHRTLASEAQVPREGADRLRRQSSALLARRATATAFWTSR